MELKDGPQVVVVNEGELIQDKEATVLFQYKLKDFSLVVKLINDRV